MGVSRLFFSNLLTMSIYIYGEGNGYPFQYSGLENVMGREAWQATIHEVAELDMTE